VHRDRRQRDDRAQSREHQKDEVEGALRIGEVTECRLECDGEEKSREDLRAGLEHAQLLEHIIPVAVGALTGRLGSPVGPGVGAGRRP